MNSLPNEHAATIHLTEPAVGGSPCATKWIHFSSDPFPFPETEAIRLLGGKGYSLNKLIQGQFRVPPAFTILTTACQQYLSRSAEADVRDADSNGSDSQTTMWPDGLWKEIQQGIRRLEAETGRIFGGSSAPLTVAVRSGAAVSMPGLMETFLHCGMTELLAIRLESEETPDADDCDRETPPTAGGTFRTSHSTVPDSTAKSDKSEEFIHEQLSWREFADFLNHESLLKLLGIDPEAVKIRGSNTNPQAFCRDVLQKCRVSKSRLNFADPDTFLKLAITAVFESWNSPAARKYRDAAGLEHSAGTAVTIQVMFPAAVAGVVLSRNPLAPEHEQMIVEAAIGLGTKLVSGQTTPVTWAVDRLTHAVQSRTDSGQILDCIELKTFESEHLPELCRTVKRLEQYFSPPLDVEFAYSRGTVVLLQARTAQSGGHTAELVAARRSLLEELRTLANQGRRFWVRHSLSETLPAPTPLTWELWQEFMSGNGGFGILYRRLGYHPSAKVAREGFLRLIGGRVYADPSNLVEMISSDYPYTFDFEKLRADSEALNRPPELLDLSRVSPWFLLKIPIFCCKQWQAGRIQRRLIRTAISNFLQVLIPRLEAYLDSENAIDLTQLSTDELYQTFERRCQRAFHDFAPETLLPGTLGSSAWSQLTQHVRRILGDVECQKHLNRWAAKIENPVAHRQFELLQDIVRDRESLQVYLSEFGHRGPNEMDLSARRWREMPDRILEYATRQAFEWAHQPDQASTNSCCDELVHILQQTGASCLSDELVVLLRHAMNLIPYREIGKHEFLKVYDLIRKVLQEYARRHSNNSELETNFQTVTDDQNFQQSGSGSNAANLAEEIERIYFFSRADLQNQISESIVKSTATARQRYLANQRLELPTILEIHGSNPDFNLDLARNRDIQRNDRTIRGTALSPGCVLGKVVLLSGEVNLEGVTCESVIVANHIDPSLVPFLTQAGAIVVSQGGMLSHVALLVRQFSIPTIVVPDILQLVNRGDRIRVDTELGIVELLDQPT